MKSNAETQEIKALLLQDIRNVLFHLFPNGQVRHSSFYIGDISGRKGDSLIFDLAGEKAGLWHDFATGEGGDIIRAWALAKGLDDKTGFPEVIKSIKEWLGYANKPKAHVDDLGPPSAKWDYVNAEGKLIACVYRYDTPAGKEYRPWDVLNRKAQAPNPRPLYNIPKILAADSVVLVEGEKCADALSEIGYIATTAMNGANAPIDKTDWLPLKGKKVIIWPDNDIPGKDYAKKVAEHISSLADEVLILNPPVGKPVKWDAADAIKEWFNIEDFINHAKRQTFGLPLFKMRTLMEDKSEMPDDLIEPRVLTPGGTLVIGGAPKVGKSDFLINLLCRMAEGESFLGFRAQRPLKILYLQAEIGYHYLRERLQSMKCSDLALENLIISPRINLILDKSGVGKVVEATLKAFNPDVPDVICIDPIRNLFDGGSDTSSENDNSDMLFFLQERIEKIRDNINPDAGIILVHHTRKINKKQLEEDPFQSFSGASSLRSFYTSGMILFKPDENKTDRHLYMELRNGPEIPRKIIDKKMGEWYELNPYSERLIKQTYGEKLDAERGRKEDLILQLIAEEGKKGNLYTINQFAERFENTHGLGGKDTIMDRIGKEEHPAASLLLVYQNIKDPETYTFVSVGDGYIFYNDEIIERSPTRKKIEDARLNKVKEYKRADRTDVRDIVSRDIVKDFYKRNHEESYPAVDISRDWLDHHEVRIVEAKLKPGDRIVMTTDGLTRLVDMYGVYTLKQFQEEVFSGGIAPLVDAVRKVELGDWNIEDVIRYKKTDDICALMLKVS